MKLFTIGFTQTSAEQFFDSLTKNKVTTLIDVRLNNSSQLSGYAKKNDLQYFLKRICNINYVHIKDLAPNKDILDQFKKQKTISWKEYEKHYLKLIQDRKIDKTISPKLFENGCLLCSEKEPHYCHRRLLAEYLNKQWGGILIKHL
ncbi:DUF488 domain-containing protein [Cyanobacterium stanieri LEGE 03274]|uniref:DUF488 domain-containing protein n=1 Tax=Cyanobacterium stanieri LEGE 03274 TaxID=1828756 RepID=A0ABR9V1K8_9CHRO|nr:DUF488 domain-containing protein [Cyanobacterium stanieri]MBE9221773.1 DUF488 domain-containing protein [Cyanobacterium stanieri LEGE 03274]